MGFSSVGGRAEVVETGLVRVSNEFGSGAIDWSPGWTSWRRAKPEIKFECNPPGVGMADLFIKILRSARTVNWATDSESLDCLSRRR